jgi:hypothetical protein
MKVAGAYQFTTYRDDITATDAAGNVTAISLTFVIKPTAKGILAAINDGAARGWMTAAEKPTLVNAINNVLTATCSLQGEPVQLEAPPVHRAVQSATNAKAPPGVPGAAPELGERSAHPDLRAASLPG